MISVCLLDLTLQQSWRKWFGEGRWALLVHPLFIWLKEKEKA